MVVAALFFSTTWAQDLGKPDSLIVKTFDCDHTYEATAGYDSVRVCLWVSHDSNTFQYQTGFVQDSIAAMVIPLTFWHQPAGHADSVVLPNWDVGTGVFYNNTEIAIDDPNPLPYSVFRDISCEGTPYTNRIRATCKWDTRVLDIESHSCDNDSGHAWFSLIAGGTRKKWFEGSNVLLATLTFWVYMNPAWDTTEIGIDTMSAPPAWNLGFVRYDAAGYVPVVNLPVKDTIYIVPNLPPHFITCPGNQTHAVNGWVTLTNAVEVKDDDGTIENVTIGFSGTGITSVQLINESGFHTNDYKADITYYVEDHCADGGTVTVTATDDLQGTGQCAFDIDLTDVAPEFTNCAALSATIYNNGTYSKTATAEDDNNDPVIFSKISGPGTLTVTGAGLITWSPLVSDTVVFDVCIKVTETGGTCALFDTCCFQITVQAVHGRPNNVEIPNIVYQRKDGVVYDTHLCVNPGDYFEIPINLKNFVAPVEIGGFELEVEFDYQDLTFFGAEKGSLLMHSESENNRYGELVKWSWEYFTYRVLPCPLCACCKYKILLYGQSEMPNGPLFLGYCLVADSVKDALGDWHQFAFPLEGDLVWLKFQVANNDLLRGLKLPVFFEWEAKLDNEGNVIEDWDCAENTMSDCTGEILYVSTDPIQFDSASCIFGWPNPMPVRLFTFTDGGVHICAAGENWKCDRGDINLDHIANTTADAVLFARYFVYGLSVFYPDTQRAMQICASDVNADGRTLMLADLIYLIRVIQRDAVPFPKLGPSSDIANVIVSDGKITVECASPIGGILFNFDGDVTPTLLNNNMELLSNEGNVLVWSSVGNSINAGAS